MKKEILFFLIGSIKKNERVALVVVVDANGHSPGKPGFCMAVSDTELVGTIGGGTIEIGMVTASRRKLLKNNTDPEISYRVHNTSGGADESGMICGGDQTTAIVPIRLSDLGALEYLANSVDGRGALKILCLSQAGITVSDNTDEVPHSFIWRENGNWEYRETIGQKYKAFIFGGGHVSLALSPILSSLGFRIIILDERPLINTIQQNKYISDLIISPFEELPKKIEEGSNSYAFIMTPGHRYDESVLRELLGKNLKYLGMIGSKKKVAEIFARLKNDGFEENSLARVRSPIGIPIGSKTAEEIAISIAAQVIQVKNNQ